MSEYVLSWKGWTSWHHRSFATQERAVEYRQQLGVRGYIRYFTHTLKGSDPDYTFGG
jgi:hypothetical protein